MNMIDLVITDNISNLIRLVPNLDNKLFKFEKIPKEEAKYFIESTSYYGKIFSYTTLVQNESLAKIASEDLRFDIVCGKDMTKEEVVINDKNAITPYKKIIVFITMEAAKIAYYLVEIFDATDM